MALALLAFGCNQTPAPRMAEGVVSPNPTKFETEIDGKPVGLYALSNENGMRVYITNHGARIVSLFAPDRNGVFDDVVLGYHSIDEFLASGEPYLGTIIGRFGNRIGNARFSLDGVEYTLTANNGPNSLHGGPGGFHRRVWEVVSHTDQSIEMTYTSAHMEEGFPGNLKVTHIITLTPNNGVLLDYIATTDKPTVVNLTNHAFFNLAGEGASTVNNHMLRINAQYYTPVDSTLIPTGEIAPVEGTPFDFREFTAIGERIGYDHPQLRYGLGYDHNFVIQREGEMGMVVAASIYDPESGRRMDVITTEPGIQFYGGNFMTGKEIGKRGKAYLHRSAFCLETQHFPDSPNKPHFPSVRLDPGQEYRTQTIYQFLVQDN